MIKKLVSSNKKMTDAIMERGGKQLFRLSVIIDVLYALHLFRSSGCSI